MYQTSHISKPPPSPPPQNIPFIDEIPIFIHKYIVQIVNVEGDSNYGYRVILTFLDKGEDKHTLVCHQLIHELRIHKESYTWLYGKKEIFYAIYESLVPCISGPTTKKNGCTSPK